jgi:hypothetical protein
MGFVEARLSNNFLVFLSWPRVAESVKSPAIITGAPGCEVAIVRISVLARIVSLGLFHIGQGFYTQPTFIDNVFAINGGESNGW